MNTSLQQDVVEYWISIKDYEGLYEVSNKGKVIRDGKELKQAKTHRGYSYVSLSKRSKVKRYYVHVLVAKAFLVQDAPERKYVNHKDGNKSNNTVENLEWVTHKENHFHAKENGLHCRGENIPWSILKTEDIIKMFDLHDQGWNTRKIATYFNLKATGRVTRILRGERWAWVCPDRHRTVGQVKVTPAVERQMVELYAEGYFQREIAEKFSLSQARIGQILRKNGIGKKISN